MRAVLCLRVILVLKIQHWSWEFLSNAFPAGIKRSKLLIAVIAKVAELADAPDLGLGTTVTAIVIPNL
jgi:hypothetical protein